MAKLRLHISNDENNDQTVVLTAIKTPKESGGDISTSWRKFSNSAPSAGEQAISDIVDMLNDAPWWLTKSILDKLNR